MVAKGKNHKPAGRKKTRSLGRIHKTHSHRFQAARHETKKETNPPQSAAGPPKEQNGFPRPEETEAADILKREGAAAPVERERSSYDGDTAIKLYLREIG